jgi:hypothetical protein
MIEQTGGCEGSPRLTGYSIKDINTHCMQEFQAHVDCLENNNQTFFNCRRPEQKLNGCIFDKLVRPDIHMAHFQASVRCKYISN